MPDPDRHMFAQIEVNGDTFVKAFYRKHPAAPKRCYWILKSFLEGKPNEDTRS